MLRGLGSTLWNFVHSLEAFQINHRKHQHCSMYESSRWTSAMGMYTREILLVLKNECLCLKVIFVLRIVPCPHFMLSSLFYTLHLINTPNTLTNGVLFKKKKKNACLHCNNNTYSTYGQTNRAKPWMNIITQKIKMYISDINEHSLVWII